MAAQQIVLCDTNILIELTKGNPAIIQELKTIGLNNITISSISACEFMFGALNKQEMARIKRALKQIQTIHTNETISQIATDLVEQFALSHHLDVADAFIAATALEQKIPLYTLNKKHFRYIPNLILYK